MKRKIIIALIAAISLTSLLSNSAYAKDYSTCLSNARSKFKVNSGSVYSQIDDVSPGSSITDAGVEWACGLSGAAGVTWITDSAGYSSSGGTYTINVNSFIKRSGNTTMGVVGAISGKTYAGDVYASNVHICNSSLTKCDGDIGISYGSGWSNAYSSNACSNITNLGWGYDFLRASYSNYTSDNGWTYPEGVAQITIDGAKLISEVGITERTGYGEITLKLYRGFNNGSTSYGTSEFKLLAEKKESKSELQNNTRMRLTANDGAHEETSGYANDAGTKPYTVNKRTTSIKFDNRLRAKVIDHDSHTAMVTWTGQGVTSGSSGNISISPDSSSWTYNPASGWNGAFNSKTETVTLDPGSNSTKCSGVTTPKYYSTVNGGSGSTSSKICAKLSRPYAYYTGTVTATVKKNTSKTNVSIPSNHYILLTDSDDGNYEISFTDTVKRKSDGAGENEKTQYSASRREASTGGISTATWSPSGASSSGDTNALAEGGSQNVFTPKVSGRLKYGEKRTFCNSMSYRARQKSSDAMTAATGSEFCITIERPRAKCAIDTAYEYGIKDGRNVGSIGVRNFNNSAKNTFSWTPVNTSATHNLSYNDSNAWAMPGDDIQFKYGACAGAYYVIEQQGITGKGTHYSTAGWLATNALGTDGSNPSVGTRTFGNSNDGYLFRNEANKYRNYSAYTNPVNKNNADLATIAATTPLPYATWTTGYNGASKPTSGFLSKPSEPIVEMYGDTDTAERAHSAKSPSISGTYGGTKDPNSYKICGKTATGCMFGKQNVGSIIVQQFTWNYLFMNNAAVAGGPTQHSATAIVRVPYNYYLRPYVVNNNDRGVVYLGENKTMYPGVVVYPRKNTLVHGGATYATVTKETTFKVRVYNANTGATIREYSKTQRLNQKGDITTTAAPDNTFMPDEGMSFEVLDNGSNQVGHRICTELKIWPVDSHETGSGSEVYGASRNSTNVTWDTQYALMEGYTTTASGNPKYVATATSCSTIAKRPTASVESSNTYSATSLTAGHYAKKFSSGNKYIFGSWSEYGVFGEVNTGKLFVSGAALGYKTNVSYNATAGYKNVNHTRDNDSTTTTASGETAGKTCVFTTQTYVNLVGNECKGSSNTIGSEAANSYRDNILDRYGKVGQDGKSSHVKVTAKTGSYYNLDIDGSQIENYRLEKDNPKSIVALYADGDAVLSSVPKFATSTNRTIVYRVNGTLIIRGSYINDERSERKTNLSDITGVIIIANRVWIDASVKYINAAIVTTNADNAEINTCKYDGGTTIKIGTGNGSAELGTLSSAVCKDALTFDGPVFTRRIIMNRSAGANAGNGSIQRGEIFNLNMANYLWSFDQMTHYSQAVTTYSRELPTRY